MRESLPRFEDILELVQSYHPGCDEELLRRSYVYSAMAHKGQVRISGEPYLVHPLEVARTLAEMRLDEVAIATGLLHDLLEDTWVTETELEAQFGEHITGLVKALTKISTMEQSFAARQAAQAETFRRMLLASVEDVRVILVKLADRLHNMRTLEHLPEARRRRIATETLEIYAPIAHRLGIGSLKAELEDLAWRQLYPEEFARLAEQIAQREERATALIEEIRTTIGTLIEEHSIGAEVRGRVKHLYSIWSKLQKQGIGLDRVYDFLAFRVIVDSVPHCYAVLGLIHQQWRPVPGRIKDYIAMPKPNAYQSLHTSVIGPEGQPFEVQIRTADMDEIAERGIAAHWLYKEGKGGTAEERVAWLKTLVEGQQENPRDFLNSLKLDLYPEEVYTFTPRGEVLAFPRGATPIDFAYRVHTEVGHHCVGARVNGRLVPLRTPLKNGDIVEILTSSTQVPRRDWLDWAVTARASNKIRQWLNRGEKEQAVDAGKRLFERECRKQDLSFKTLRDDGTVARLSSDHGFGREDDLYAALGFGRLSPRDLLAPLTRGDEPPEAAVPARPRSKPAADAAIVVKGYRDLLVYRAQCCNPLPGDEIVGYVTRGKGVAVHAADCPNLRRLLFTPEREVEVAWEGEEGAFSVPLEVQFEDRPAMLASVSRVVADEDANIRSCHLATQDEQVGTLEMTVDVRGRNHLERVLQVLRAVPGVIAVTSQSKSRPRRLEAAR